MNDLIGKTIGSYTVLGQLGAGAMGEVYLAEHRHLKRKAALKLLSREIVDRPDLLERFFLEARATSAIAHPGIVQIFDCEVEPGGRPYIVMEYLTGETLAATLARRGALPPVTVARMARGIAEALGAAHGKGIVHRDLKPENIFVEPEPPDTIKLVDFGIAKLAGDIQAGQVHKTRSGSLLGTPLYMSPEQCRDSANIDYRTDIYSLGCVCYEMLTGRPPFTHESLGDLVVAHMTQAPQDVRALNPSVPTALAELTAELLRKEPAARPPNMRAVAERLAGFLARATTVPESLSTPSAAFAPAVASTKPGATATTFGDSASEIADGNDDIAVPRSNRPLLIGAALAVVLAGGGLAALRRGGSPTANVTPTATTAATATTATATTAPGTRGATTPPEPPPGEPPARGKPKPVTEHAATVEPVAERGTERHGKRRLAQATSGAATKPTEPPAAAAKAPPEPRAAEPVPPRPVAAPAGLAGSWEGPWNDPDKHQNGRFALQVGADGGVAGWMANTTAHQTFRMVGRLSPAGALELTCQCPANQAFTARGSVHTTDDGELKAQLTLSNGAGAFGQSHLTLKRH